jgi:hypothetical protein
MYRPLLPSGILHVLSPVKDYLTAQMRLIHHPLSSWLALKHKTPTAAPEPHTSSRQVEEHPVKYAPYTATFPFGGIRNPFTPS